MTFTLLTLINSCSQNKYLAKSNLKGATVATAVNAGVVATEYTSRAAAIKAITQALNGGAVEVGGKLYATKGSIVTAKGSSLAAKATLLGKAAVAGKVIVAGAFIVAAMGPSFIVVGLAHHAMNQPGVKQRIDQSNAEGMHTAVNALVKSGVPFHSTVLPFNFHNIAHSGVLSEFGALHTEAKLSKLSKDEAVDLLSQLFKAAWKHKRKLGWNNIYQAMRLKSVNPRVVLNNPNCVELDCLNPTNADISYIKNKVRDNLVQKSAKSFQSNLSANLNKFYKTLISKKASQIKSFGKHGEDLQTSLAGKERLIQINALYGKDHNFNFEQQTLISLAELVSPLHARKAAAHMADGGSPAGFIEKLTRAVINNKDSYEHYQEFIKKEFPQKEKTKIKPIRYWQFVGGMDTCNRQRGTGKVVTSEIAHNKAEFISKTTAFQTAALGFLMMKCYVSIVHPETDFIFPLNSSTKIPDSFSQDMLSSKGKNKMRDGASEALVSTDTRIFKRYHAVSSRNKVTNAAYWNACKAGNAALNAYEPWYGGTAALDTIKPGANFNPWFTGMWLLNRFTDWMAGTPLKAGIDASELAIGTALPVLLCGMNATFRTKILKQQHPELKKILKRYPSLVNPGTVNPVTGTMQGLHIEANLHKADIFKLTYNLFDGNYLPQEACVHQQTLSYYPFGPVKCH